MISVFKGPARLIPFIPMLLLGPAIATAQPNKDLANVTILIVRHAEKPDDGDTLTPQGEARAKAYAGYFTHLKVEGHNWKTTHIFAAADSKHSQRPRLTLTPLSESLMMPLDLRFDNKDVMGIAQDIATHVYGKDILICWHHGKIPDLIAALGADPSPLFPTGKWPGSTYDWVVEVPFDRKGEVKKSGVKLIHEHLMPGDSR